MHTIKRMIYREGQPDEKVEFWLLDETGGLVGKFASEAEANEALSFYNSSFPADDMSDLSPKR